MNPPTVSIAQPQQRAQVLATIVLGFSADPLTRWFYPEASDYLASTDLFDAFGGAAVDAGSAYVTSRFEGAALWMPPGTHPDEERVVSILEKSIHSSIIEDVVSVFEKMDEYHPDEEIWYLPLVAVDPACQGQGIGSALMKAALNRCDEDKLPAYLESSNPRNISLYERYGFEIMGEIQIGSSPVITPMYRSAN